MDLFNPHTTNVLLPYDGEVIYYGVVIPQQEADLYYDTLFHQVEWRNDESFIMGKRVVTKRKVAWYGDRDFSYTYSGVTKTALPWLPVLSQLKKIAEATTGSIYNSCLLNLYHDGSEGMAWHSDGEKMLQKHGAIASISFGAERKFAFKHKKTGEKVALVLQHGSVLVMKGTTQDNWLHRLPPTIHIKRPRINLTFRTIMNHG